MIRGTAIDFALALIDAIRWPHETFNTRQIAAVVNMLHEEGFGSGTVRHQDIYFIERRALQKLGKALLRKGMDKDDADKLREILNGPRYAHVGGVQKSRYRYRRKALTS